MHSPHEQPEADVVLGAFPRLTQAPTDQPCESCRSRPACEVIDIAPFLTSRRQRETAAGVPTSDPA